VTKPLSRNEMRARAVTFAARWKDETSEKSGSQMFWREFLEIFGVDVRRVAYFEQLAKRTSTGNYGFIDLYWPGVLIAEQKSAGKDLDEAEKQALDYLTGIKQSDFPGLVITSDFARIRILDLEAKDPKPVEINTADLGKEYERFLFIAGYAKQTFEQEVEANVAASELMGQLYDAAEAAGYKDHEANVLLTRLLFLMFGDDTAMWARGLFYSFVHDRTSDDASDLGAQLAMLFQVLNTPENERPKNLDQTLVDFPYVNGGLFSENLRIAAFTPEMRHALIKAMRFGWGGISPAVFGSLFQSVKSKELRRELGEHYTPEKTIMKVIGPLFLDDLKERLTGAKGSPQKLRNLRKELATYNFLDPACGCGNFLIVAYREMRRLELQILKQLRDLKEDNQLALDPTLGLQVSVAQFAGIEIEEWPAKVAETAMFLVDHQMNLELAEEFGQTPDRLPIKQMLNVRVGNALTTDWRDVCPIGDNTLILGNPPFMGRYTRDKDTHTSELKSAFGDAKGSGNIDYVCAWFARAADYTGQTQARVAFIATNSIAQGEQPGVVWSYLSARGMSVDFAHTTFAWSSDAPQAAAVHVVVVGFSRRPKSGGRLFLYATPKSDASEVSAKSINGYLTAGPSVIVASRSEPIDPDAQSMRFGSMPHDGGFLLVEPEDAVTIRANDPIAARYLRKLIGARELIQGQERFCLWLVDAPASDVRGSKEIMRRAELVAEERRKSPDPAAVKAVATPTLFKARRQPEHQYLAVPGVSSESRRYVPMALFSPDVIATNALLTIDNADLFTFGVLHGRLFQVWNATVSGRMKSDFRISAEITYNNYPWPVREAASRVAIEAAAQGVIDARTKHPDQTLADLYNPLGMPPDLLKAHEQLDRVVLAAYGLKPSTTDAEVLSALFTRYEELVAPMAGMMEKKSKKR
jgi:hypothetical protein